MNHIVTMITILDCDDTDGVIALLERIDYTARYLAYLNGDVALDDDLAAYIAWRAEKLADARACEGAA